MENDFRTATKRFWITIQCTLGMVCCLPRPKDVVDWWREYFEDLFSPTDMPSGEEAGPGDPGMASLISRAEAAEVSCPRDGRDPLKVL